MVPREAVQSGPQGSSVIVVDKTSSVAQHRPVTTGASDADGIAITEGLQPGEQVVVLSAMPLKDGQVVRVGGGRPEAEDMAGRPGPDSGETQASAPRT